MIPWKRNPVIYEINTRVWLGELSHNTGLPLTLAHVPEEEWNRIAGLKVDAVWLMGIWERSPEGIRISNHHEGNLADFRRALPDFAPDDNTGSPYCIKSYTADPYFGGNEALAVARHQLASRGIRLILDFVPNHLAHDHQWITTYPDFFIQGTREDLRDDPITFVEIHGTVYACGKDPYYPAWQDVIQVNAFNPALREAIIETVTAIAGLCDGIRCDMAMLMASEVVCRTWGKRAGPRPEMEYWEELIPAVKRAHPGFIFLAEAYWEMEWEMMRQGFDYCYDKRLYDRLEQGAPQPVRLHLSAPTAFQEQLVRFIENHDEPRAASLFAPDRERAAALIAATLPGATLVHEGQIEGRRVRLPVFLRRRPNEPVDEALCCFTKKLLEIVADPIFHNGSWRLLEANGWPDNDTARNLLCWEWEWESDRIMVIINFSETGSQGMIMPATDALRNSMWRLLDPLSGDSFDRDGDEMTHQGLFVNLPPWGFHLLRFTTF